MSTLKDVIANAWEKLNPLDPTPIYLLKFMGFALFVFAIGLAIGAMTM